MKRAIVAFVAGIAVAASSTAYAASQYWGNRDVACKAYKKDVICMRRDGHGYAVGISWDLVTVGTTKGKIFYAKPQP